MNADGEFRRIVGLGRFLDSGAKATKFAGGQVDSRVSVILETLGFSLVVGRHGDGVEVDLVSRRKRYSVRGMPMKRRQMRIGRFGRRVQRDHGDFKDDVGGMAEEI